VRIGLVSDTHGLFDPALAQVFARCAAILHAGDVLRPAVLAALEALAPVTAVRGNNDDAPPLDSLPETALVPVGVLEARWGVSQIQPVNGRRPPGRPTKRTTDPTP